MSNENEQEQFNNVSLNNEEMAVTLWTQNGIRCQNDEYFSKDCICTIILLCIVIASFLWFIKIIMEIPDANLGMAAVKNDTWLFLH